VALMINMTSAFSSEFLPTVSLRFACSFLFSIGHHFTVRPKLIVRVPPPYVPVTTMV
jgi:hypothetical protein